MTHSYKVTGMTCEGCVAKVKHKLLAHPDVTAADVKLDDQNVTVTMQKHISLEDLQSAIGNDSKYKIIATHEGHSLTGDHMAAAEPLSWLATYKPLLLITAFITAVAIITSGGSLAQGMNYFMAGFFLVFSFFKLLDLKGFAES